jgi:hypothetical protein
VAGAPQIREFWSRSVNERFSFAWQPWTLMVCGCGSAFCSSRSKNFAIASADFLDYLPEMNERGLILPKIHL